MDLCKEKVQGNNAMLLNIDYIIITAKAVQYRVNAANYGCHSLWLHM